MWRRTSGWRLLAVLAVLAGLASARAFGDATAGSTYCAWEMVDYAIAQPLCGLVGGPVGAVVGALAGAGAAV